MNWGKILEYLLIVLAVITGIGIVGFGFYAIWMAINNQTAVIESQSNNGGLFGTILSALGL